MALQYSPKIVQDSLVMCLDASQNKSYPAADLPVKNGLVMWMDAADDTTFSYSSGATVSQWRDKSGFNYHMVPKSGGPTRTAILNSRKALAFTTSQTIGNNTIDLSTSANSVFVVSRLTGTTNNRVLTCNLDASGNNWLLGQHGSTANDYYAEGWVYDAASPVDVTSWKIFMGDWSGPSTDLANFYTNGTALATNSTAASQGPKYLGVNYYSGETSTNEVAEIIVFNRVLTTAERRLIHTYLGQKWGISNTDRSIVDLSNNNNHGLLGGVAGSQVVADMPLFDVYNKGALKLDGSTDYIAVENATSLNPTTVTVSIWVKRNGYQSQTANYLRRNYNDAYAILSSPTDDSSLRFRIHNGTTYPESPTTTLALNEWTNIVGTYDLANIKIYKNGVFVGQTAHTSAISYSSADTTLTIGRDDPIAGRYMNANYGSVLIYSRALSAAEVLQNYEAQKSKFANTIVQQGLVLNLDAGNPYSYAGAGATWYDVSGNNYNGTLIGSPAYTSNNNGGIIFDSNAKYGTLPTSGLAFGTGQFAIEAWIFSTAAVTNNIIYASQSSNVAGFIALYYANGSGFALTDFNAVGVRTTTTHQTAVSQNTWYHVVGVRNASNQYIVYVNGVVSTTNATSSATLSASAPQIASNPATTGERFTGTMASLRLYTRQLSAAEVLQNYNATKGRFGL